MSTKDNSILSSLKFIFPIRGALRIVLAGCGGTGSWLAPALARLARLLTEKDREVELVFCDPDAAEEKNIYRQNFCAAEIGQNKAEALATRYALAWGIEIASAGARFEEFSGLRGFDDATILCGCVDGPAGRQEMADYCRRNANVIWLDAGNEQTSGQVLAGCSDSARKDAFGLPGLCAWLPLPSLQEPELVTLTPPPSPRPSPAKPGEGENAQTLSCAEMALRGAQGLTINQAMASIMADYIFRIVLTQDLRRFATYIDLASGVMTSKYITREAINGWLHKRKR